VLFIAIFLPTPLPGDVIVLNSENFPIVSAFAATTPSYLALDSIETKWVTNIHNLDIDLGHTIGFGETFYLRPHCGIRSMWLNERFRFQENDPAAPVLVEGKFTEKVYGFGVEGGLLANWNIGYGFSLVGHVGGSMLYSKFTIRERETATGLVSGVETTFVDVYDRNTKRLGTPSMDYYLGLEYVSCFCEMELNIHAGWEQHTLFDINQLAANSGNLSSQGLTLGLDLSF